MLGGPILTAIIIEPKIEKQNPSSAQMVLKTSGRSLPNLSISIGVTPTISGLASGLFFRVILALAAIVIPDGIQNLQRVLVGMENRCSVWHSRLYATLSTQCSESTERSRRGLYVRTYHKQVSRLLEPGALQTFKTITICI